jgi:quercetin dioxygenase-like cupin family protein
VIGEHNAAELLRGVRLLATACRQDIGTMSITNRTVTNTVTGETITFLETSAETGGVRVVAEITLTPGGAVIPHSHRVSETFECLDGSFITHLAGNETEFTPGQRMIAKPHEMHGFRNDTAQPAILKVTATPAGDLDRTLRTLCGLSRDGLLMPGKPPRPAFAMASLRGATATISRRYPDGFTG